MKRVHRPGTNRSFAGSSYESSDEDESGAFCFSPENEDQRRRFFDLVALALASSRDYGLSQPQSAPWDGDESDSESHPSLESDAEAELLDLFDEEEETESGCFLESSISTRSPSVDGSSESYDATVIQNRKLLLLNRQQRQQSTAFRESNSFCTNHANLLSPDLMILVERILNENRRTSSKEKKFDRKPASQSSPKDTKAADCNYAVRGDSTNCEKKEEAVENNSDRVRVNANVMDHLRNLVYKKYGSPSSDRSETESIHSSVLPVSPTLLKYRDALKRTPTTLRHQSPESIPDPTRTKLKGKTFDGASATVESPTTTPIICDLVTSTPQALKAPVSEASPIGAAPCSIAGSNDAQIQQAPQTARGANIYSHAECISSIIEKVIDELVTETILGDSGATVATPSSSEASEGNAQPEIQRKPLVEVPEASDDEPHYSEMGVRETVTSSEASAIEESIEKSENHDDFTLATLTAAELHRVENLVISIEEAKLIIAAESSID